MNADQAAGFRARAAHDYRSAPAPNRGTVTTPAATLRVAPSSGLLMVQRTLNIARTAPSPSGVFSLGSALSFQPPRVLGGCFF